MDADRGSLKMPRGGHYQCRFTHPDEVFVGCAFGKRARRCRAEGLFASAVVPEGIPPQAALAWRTLWLVKHRSPVVLFPERPADLFATVSGYWVVPRTFRDGSCDDE